MDKAKSAQILLISNQDEQCREIRSALKSTDCDCLAARSVDDGLELVTGPCMALVIANVDDAADFRAIRRFRHSEFVPDLPIIFLVSESLAISDAFDAELYGNVDCLTKPLHHKLLLCKVQNFLKTHELNHELEQEMRERQEAIALLSDEKRYVESLINSSTDMIISVDLKRRIFEFNHRAQEVFGYTKEEVLGKPIDMLYAYLDQSWCVYENTVKRKQYTAEVINRKKNGDLFQSMISTSVLVERGGKLLGTMGISRDITEEKRVLKQLKDAKDQAEAANRAKGEFLTHMSHELRTPMYGIVGYAELLKDVLANQPEYIDLVETVERNGQHLLRIINEILDLSRAESGKLTVEHGQCQPYVLVNDVVNFMLARSEEQGVTLRTEIEGMIPETIYSDRTRVMQCLLNLVGNAVKFTSRGGEVVICVRYLMNAGTPTLAFAVSDTGIGIPADQLALIMEPFEQGDPSISVKYGGTGLGLTITKRMAALLGGDLVVESEVDEGSTFTLTIDCGLDATGITLRDADTLQKMTAELNRRLRTERSQSVPKLRGKIIVAEDNPDIQKLLRHFITGAGAEVEIVETGPAALQTALNHESDLLILDMRLPEMSGIEVVKHLRLNGYIRPIVGLTAAGTDKEIRRFLESGCDDCAIKPISRIDLIRLLRKWLRQVKSTFTLSGTLPDGATGVETSEIRRSVENNSPIFSAFHNDPNMSEIIEGYVLALPEKHDTLMRALKAGDVARFKTVVHGLHGSGGGFGFQILSDIGEELENAIADGIQSKDLVKTMRKLRRTIDRISRAYSGRN